MYSTVTEPRRASAGTISRPSDRRTVREKFALIIPTLHEAGNIQVLLQRIRETLDPHSIEYEVIIVDDDSRDGIVAIVDQIAGTDPRVRLITRRGERGLAGAITHGWENTDATVLGAIDADLQHPPEILPQMLERLGLGADLVVASRYAAGGSLNKWSRARHLVSSLAIWTTLPLQRSGLRTSDPMSGFFLVRRNCVDDLTLQRSGFKILLEILVRGDLNSLSEVPFCFGHRKAGTSKASIRVALDYFKLLARLYNIRLTALLKQPASGTARPAAQEAHYENEAAPVSVRPV